MRTGRIWRWGLARLLLRLAVGATFIWLGLGKLLATWPVQGENAAILANMGALSGPAPATAPAPSPAAPPSPSPSGPSPPAPAASPGHDPMPADEFRSPQHAPGAAPPAGAPAAPSAVPPRFSAADFPSPVPVRRMYLLSLRLHRAANPPPREDGTVPQTLWPARLAQGNWPVWAAWAALAIELGGGALVLMGMLTRLCAAAIALALLGSIWLEQIGPAVQSGQTLLGFLPSYDVFDPERWIPLLWRVSLLMSALALALAGAGAAAIDNALFGTAIGGGGGGDDDEL